MLSQRRQRVLQAVIEEYVANAMPVASKTLVKNYSLGVSSATVRNELSVLEENGYIAQPHTSAGRIPTDFGYRTFVDELLRSELPSLDESRASAVRELRESARELDELMDRTSHVLSRLTDCMSIVLPPSTLSLHLKQVSLISMHPRKVLMVVITETGRVLNRNVTFYEDVMVEEVQAVERLINEVFAGKTFTEMREALDIQKASLLGNDLTQVLIHEMFACLQENGATHAHNLGLSTLMQQPEFHHSNVLVPLLQAVEDGSVAVSVVDSTQGEDVSVRIGSENDHESMSNVSVVAARYGKGDAEGIIAVVGPTRMQYSRIISAIRSVQQELNDIG